MNSVLTIILVIISFGLSSQEKVLKPILIEKEAYSGVGLKKVKDKNQPDRDLAQKMLYRGPDLMVFIVASNTASADIESYSLDEFIYLISGGAVVESDANGKKSFVAGDYFLAPRGFRGKWSTIGAPKYHHELSVIASRRTDFVGNDLMSFPEELNKQELSGVSELKGGTAGPQLKSTDLEVFIQSEIPSSREIVEHEHDVLISILAGTLEVTDIEGESTKFHTGDFLVLPAGFRGKWQTDALDHFRYVMVRKVKT